MNKRNLKRRLKKDYKEFLKENRDLVGLAESFLKKLQKKYNCTEEQLYATLYKKDLQNNLPDDKALFLKHLLFLLDSYDKVPVFTSKERLGNPRKEMSLVKKIGKWAEKQLPAWISINLGIALKDTIVLLKEEYGLPEEDIVIYTVDSLLTDMLENPFKYQDAYRMESIISDSIF